MGFGWLETGRSQHLPLAVNAQGNSRINLQTLQGDMLTTGKTIAKLTSSRRRSAAANIATRVLRRFSSASSIDCCCMASMRDRRPTDCWSSTTGARDSLPASLSIRNSCCSASILARKCVLSMVFSSLSNPCARIRSGFHRSTKNK